MEQLIFTLETVVDNLNGDEVTAPTFSITYGGTEYTFDFAIFNPYMDDIHGVILCIIWLAFIFRTYRRLPEIIHGVTASHDVIDSRVQSSGWETTSDVAVLEIES